MPLSPASFVMSRIVKRLFVTLLAVAAAFGAYAFIESHPFPWPPARTSLHDRGPVVIRQIRSLSRLETVSYTGQKILEGRTERSPLPNWLAGDRLLFAAQGEVSAGIDLSRFDHRRIRFDGDRVIVRLPRPEVFHVRLDNRASAVHHRSTGWLIRPDAQLETAVRRRAEDRLLEAAVTDGILESAGHNAEREVRRLLVLMGAKEVQFI